MSAEQEPDPRGRVRLDLFRADSKSSRSPPSWKSLLGQTSSGKCQAAVGLNIYELGIEACFMSENGDKTYRKPNGLKENAPSGNESSSL